MGKHLNE
jgi:serine/threonine protein kinase